MTSQNSHSGAETIISAVNSIFTPGETPEVSCEPTSDNTAMPGARPSRQTSDSGSSFSFEESAPAAGRS